MKIYSHFYEFVTGEHKREDIFVDDEMFEELRKADFAFIDSERTEDRRDNNDCSSVEYADDRERQGKAQNPETIYIRKLDEKLKAYRLRVLKKLTSSLTPLQYEIIDGIYYQNLEQIEIANKKNRSKKTINTIYKRTLRKFKRNLKKLSN